MTMNLFQNESTLAAIEKVLERHPRVNLVPRYDSEEWSKARKNPHLQDLVRPQRVRALEEISTKLPFLTDELYANFKRTGQRLPFERVYFERRRQLGRAAISLLMGEIDDTERDSLTGSMIEKFTSIFEEVSWALPAHVNWHNDDVSGKEPLQIDLFCAETANLMAEMLDLFGDLIPAALQARIRERLRTHVFENYQHNFDSFHWTKATHNWNAVCHQGVIGSALSQMDDAGFLAQMLVLARQSLPLFLSGFTRDGGCSEGVGYWGYGFGWFTMLNEQLETRTHGELSLFEGDDHIRNIARFGPRMALAGGKLVNFSDNGADGSLSPSLLAYLGSRLKEPECTFQSNRSYLHLFQTGIDREAERCDVFFLGRLFLRCPIEPSVQGAPPAEDCFLPDLAVLVAHGKDSHGHTWDFAAKAGHNEEHHNHNDCGGFILNIDGVRFIMEIGAPEYVHDFFGPKRYEFLAARSLGHSVPMINGFEQLAGSQYASQVLTHAENSDQVEFGVDATACYPSDAGCRQFTRSFLYEKQAGKLTIRDTFELSRAESLESALIAGVPVRLEKNYAIVESGGLQLIVRPLPGTKLGRVEVHCYKSRGGTEASIYRLVLEPETLFAQVSLAAEMILA